MKPSFIQIYTFELRRTTVIEKMIDHVRQIDNRQIELLCSLGPAPKSSYVLRIKSKIKHLKLNRKFHPSNGYRKHNRRPGIRKYCCHKRERGKAAGANGTCKSATGVGQGAWHTGVSAPVLRSNMSTTWERWSIVSIMTL